MHGPGLRVASSSPVLLFRILLSRCALRLVSHDATPEPGEKLPRSLRLESHNTASEPDEKRLTPFLMFLTWSTSYGLRTQESACGFL